MGISDFVLSRGDLGISVSDRPRICLEIREESCCLDHCFTFTLSTGRFQTIHDTMDAESLFNVKVRFTAISALHN